MFFEALDMLRCIIGVPNLVREKLLSETLDLFLQWHLLHVCDRRRALGQMLVTDAFSRLQAVQRRLRDWHTTCNLAWLRCLLSALCHACPITMVVGVCKKSILHCFRRQI